MRYIVFFLALIVMSPAHAARLELKNGDRITGQWLDADAQTVRFASQYGSVVRVPRGEVAGLFDDNGAMMPLPQEQAALPAPSPAAPLAEANEKPQPGFLGATWKNNVAVGAGLHSGNADEKSLNADFSTKAKWDTDRANLDADYNWAQSDGERTEDNKELAGNYDRFLPASWLGDDKWYINTNASGRQDKIADLKLRSVLGMGLGRQFYETDDTYLSASLGPSWLRQDFYEDETESSIAARWNIDYDQKFFDDLFSVFHKHSLYLPSDDINAYLFDADSGIRIPIRDGFSATAEWELNVNNEPSQDAGRSDSIYSLKLGYEW